MHVRQAFSRCVMQIQKRITPNRCPKIRQIFTFSVDVYRGGFIRFYTNQTHAIFVFYGDQSIACLSSCSQTNEILFFR